MTSNTKEKITKSDYIPKNYHNTKITKSDYISKAKNFTKKSKMQKWMPGQFQSTLQIWPLLKKVEFLGAQNAPFGRPQRLNAIWCVTPIITFYQILFYAHHYFSTLRIFYINMATSKGGEDLRIVGWETSHYTKVYKIPGPTHGLEKITLAVPRCLLISA